MVECMRSYSFGRRCGKQTELTVTGLFAKGFHKVGVWSVFRGFVKMTLHAVMSSLHQDFTQVVCNPVKLWIVEQKRNRPAYICALYGFWRIAEKPSADFCQAIGGNSLALPGEV